MSDFNDVALAFNNMTNDLIHYRAGTITYDSMLKTISKYVDAAVNHYSG